ncbi:hypothetical protein BDW74DRAFT_172020 [Aspergillus multicolor]|uniref:alkene reductase n=1 Tax=Aspergillus multicolor TaxID=41759 RepID=UPI003CCD19BC
MSQPSKLFTPLTVGRLHLQHRIAMAPMTRFRSDEAHVPVPIVPTYYAQRASTPGTLIITEATFISPRAAGQDNVPGIYTADQIAAWKEVTAAVHAKDSFIFLQLWALGRAATHESIAKEGHDVVSSSDVPMAEGAPVPRPLSEDEIEAYIREYAQAAKNAIAAGFDGVEVHGANGYLIDQFTQDTANKRTDQWGGSVANRSRFAVRVAQAVVEAVGADRVGYRLSPFSHFQGMKMEDPVPQFSDLLRKLRGLGLAYVHLVEPRISGAGDAESSDTLDFAFEVWGGESPIILAGGFKPETAKVAVDVQHRDRDVMIAFGRHFTSNPDLPSKVKQGVELVPYDRDTFYKVGAPEGYVDYP